MSSMASLGRSQSSIGYEKPGPASGTRRSEAGPFILIKPGEKIFLAIVYPLYKTFSPYATLSMEVSMLHSSDVPALRDHHKAWSTLGIAPGVDKLL